jgi:Fe-S-cluster containining protein
MTVPLSRPYTTPFGLPVITHVDPAIFTATFFGDCLDCCFCHDSCCQYGARVDGPGIERLSAHAEALEPYLGIPRDQWLEDWREPDADYPGGLFTRTRVVDGRCVFANRRGRGCLLQKYALETGLDVHALKPMVCSTFPVLWEAGVLGPAPEVAEHSLVCLGPATTLYRSARAALARSFGDGLVTELDDLEGTVLGPSTGTRRSGTLGLPVLRAPAPNRHLRLCSQPAAR